MRRMTLTTLLAALLLMTMGMGAALAAPVNNPYADQLTLECNGDTIDVVVARGNPAFVVGSTDRLIPHEFNFEIVVVVDGDEYPLAEETHSVGNGKKTGLEERLVTCTFSFEIPVEFLSPEERALLDAFLEEEGFEIEDVDAIIAYGSVIGAYAPPR
jgi:hypothetical protein